MPKMNEVEIFSNEDGEIVVKQFNYELETDNIVLLSIQQVPIINDWLTKECEKASEDND